MATPPLSLRMDLSTPAFTSPVGAPILIVPPGVDITSIQVEILDAAAAGNVFLHVGAAGAAPIPLANQGRAWCVGHEMGGIWLENTGGAAFQANTLLWLVIGIGGNFDAES